MLPVLGGKGPSVSLVASYNFENGADLGDDTTGTNDLEETCDPAQDADEKEGSNSCIFDGNDALYLADPSLSATFPLKDGTTNRTFAGTMWVKATSYGTVKRYYLTKGIETSTQGMRLYIAGTDETPGHTHFDIYTDDGGGGWKEAVNSVDLTATCTAVDTPFPCCTGVVFAPEILGRQVFDEFVALPPTQQSPTAESHRGALQTSAIHGAMHYIQTHLSRAGIAKDEFNAQQKFKYRGIDDVYNALGPLLSEAKVFVVPMVLTRSQTERTSASGNALFSVVVEMEFRFVSAEDGSFISVRRSARRWTAATRRRTRRWRSPSSTPAS